MGKEKKTNNDLESLQLRLLKVQQRIWRKKERAVIVFEGVDAAGKGGAIRAATEKLDPRGFLVYPIGAPTIDEKAEHYLQRFWSKLPKPGLISIFDRSWYGRVLVEKVDHLTPKKRLKQAYEEINQFEKMLQQDGIVLIKIYIQIHRKEQLRRFEERRNDPAKRWKLTPDDLRAGKAWPKYMKAVDEMLSRTSPRSAPWVVIQGDSKDQARREVLKTILAELE